MHTNPLTEKKGHTGHNRERVYTNYQFRGNVVCRKFFQFVFGVGEKILKNVKKHFVANGIMPAQHGKTNVAVKRNTLSIEDRQAAITFIKRFS